MIFQRRRTRLRTPPVQVGGDERLKIVASTNMFGTVLCVHCIFQIWHGRQIVCRLLTYPLADARRGLINKRWIDLLVPDVSSGFLYDCVQLLLTVLHDVSPNKSRSLCASVFSRDAV